MLGNVFVLQKKDKSLQASSSKREVEAFIMCQDLVRLLKRISPLCLVLLSRMQLTEVLILIQLHRALSPLGICFEIAKNQIAGSFIDLSLSLPK
jgi:hypothetical protein